MENYNEKLNWRYATKKFNPEKSLSQEDVDYLQKSIQLSASSYGLQPYEVFVVTDKETKEKLKEAAWGQSQLTDASHVFIFAGLKKLNEDYIDSYLENISKIREVQVLLMIREGLPNWVKDMWKYVTIYMYMYSHNIYKEDDDASKM